MKTKPLGKIDQGLHAIIAGMTGIQTKVMSVLTLEHINLVTKYFTQL